MPESSHWPFVDAGQRHARGSDHSAELENKKAREAERAMLRQRMRSDRLIVGGRAHSKKSGLS